MGQEKVWDYFQNTHQVDSFEEAAPRYRFLASQTASEFSVLNIGVGCGGLERELQARGRVVSALDPSPISIDHLRTSLGLGERAQIGYSQQMPFADGSFDVVIMTEVLEHLDQDVFDQTLKEIQRVLKSHGRFIGTVPADEVLVQGTTVCPSCGHTFHRWGHALSFGLNSLRTSLESSGFSQVRVEYRSFPDWHRRGLKNLIKSTIRYALGRVGSPISIPSLFFTCQKPQRG